MSNRIDISAHQSALERLKELADSNMITALMFDSKEYKKGYQRGAEWAFAEMRKQIELCAVNKMESPIQNLYDFIDGMLCKTK